MTSRIALGLGGLIVAAVVVLPSAASTPDLAPAAADPPPSEVVAEGVWVWPFDPQPEVIAPFVAPRSRYGPGHRGLDLAGSVDQSVRAVADGVVTHRGRIAGRGTITITHADGIRSTYEPVRSDLSKGTRVRRGESIARLTDEPGHCAPASCLHLGALRGRDYLDPLPFFGARRVILLPMS